MFVKARLKLTGWYLIIIMMVSLTFSGVIYRAASFELERFAAAQRNRFERRVVDFDLELIAETKQRILSSLLVINLGILIFAGVLGYYLSGKTLMPIKEMMDEQYRFVSDASHELKTPITAIKTTLEVAIRDKEMEITEAKNTLVTSLDEVNRLQNLAEGLLELTQNKSMVLTTLTNLEEVIDASIKTIKPIASKKNITIQAKTPKILVMLNELDMTRAIVAILDNAIKYSEPKGKIEIIATVMNKFIQIKIIDHGSGIAKKALPFLFDRFYRSDPARSESGYGLGLAIAKQIITEQNGKIGVESKIKNGTTITINLPYSARLQHMGR